jgi:4-aminobutyrate aminotransferase-like enzyme
MSSHLFTRDSKTVPLVESNNRIIKTEIPCPGTSEILEKLDKYESRSMHGQLPLVWDSASNFNIYDASGNKFIDFTSAIFFANVGHSNHRVIEYMNHSLKKPIMGCYAYGSEIRAQYLEKLLKFSGPKFNKAFLMSAGTEATEAAFKLMRMSGQNKNKRKLGIIAFENNWHGRTLAAQMMSGNLQQKEWVGYHDKNIHHLKFPYPWVMNNQSGESFFYDQIKILAENGIDLKKDICGMILETFQGWGAIFYPNDFVQAAEDYCKKNNVVMTFDEMQSGFGRTGKAFGYEHYDVSPDLLCLGKGMGNGYPLSGVIGGDEIMDLPEIGNMSSTHSANPLGCSAGMAVLDEINDNNLIYESDRKGKILHEKLNQIKINSNGLISAVLGKGMIASILFQDKINKLPESLVPSKISEKCMQKGLLVVHTGRESIKIGPPLTITDEALLEGLSVIEEIIGEFV